MKALTIIKDKQKRKAWLRAFRMWQRRPYEVAPLGTVTHECASCKNEFQGSYCPRCGQSAQIGRFSFKTAFLLFLDVWGMGNRSMFRSLRDLVLRPGYMIRDYLGGMQSAYFPPFKMFFVLAAISALVTTSPTAPEETTIENRKEKTVVSPLGDERGAVVKQKTMEFMETMKTLSKKNPAIYSLLMLIFFYLPLYFFFRKSPALPNLRFSEFVIALVYSSNAYSIFSIAEEILSWKILYFMALLTLFMALKQYSGFSTLRLLVSLFITFIISFVIFTAVLVLIVLISGLSL